MHRAEGFDTGSALPLAKDRRLLDNFGCSKPMPAASDVAIVETCWTVLLDLASRFQSKGTPFEAVATRKSHF